MARNKFKYFTKSDIYDVLEQQYYGRYANMTVKRNFTKTFIKDFFDIIFDKLIEGYVVELNGFGSFKVVQDKKTITNNTVAFTSSKKINEVAVNSGEEKITEKELAETLANHLFQDEDQIKVPRRFLCEAVVSLLRELKTALIDGYKVSIRGFGEIHVETDVCHSYKTKITRNRTRAVFIPSKSLYKMVNNKED